MKSMNNSAILAYIKLAFQYTIMEEALNYNITKIGHEIKEHCIYLEIGNYLYQMDYATLILRKIDKTKGDFPTASVTFVVDYAWNEIKEHYNDYFDHSNNTKALINSNKLKIRELDKGTSPLGYLARTNDNLFLPFFTSDETLMLPSIQSVIIANKPLSKFTKIIANE